MTLSQVPIEHLPLITIIAESLIISLYIDQGLERSGSSKTEAGISILSTTKEILDRVSGVITLSQAPIEHLPLIIITAESLIISLYIDQGQERSGSSKTEAEISILSTTKEILDRVSGVMTLSQVPIEYLPLITITAESLIISLYIDQGLERSGSSKTEAGISILSTTKEILDRVSGFMTLSQVPIEHLPLITITAESLIISLYIDQGQERSGSSKTEVVISILFTSKETLEMELVVITSSQALIRRSRLITTITGSLMILPYIDQELERSRSLRTETAHSILCTSKEIPEMVLEVTT
jgi:hypothetical protein